MIKPTLQHTREALVPGNIDDLGHRLGIPNPEGGTSTVLSMGIGEGNLEVLIPRVVEGQILSPEDAIRYYLRTGKHLGKYVSIPDSNMAGERIHEQEAATLANQREAVR